MTANLNLPARLTVTPDIVAKDIQLAILKRKDVLYTPWFWGLIMLIIRSVPTLIFKRLKF
jgi:decaprenylphospho-beta-D-erythro-pentofuranosid-2-ulose 2-reductase